LGLDMEQNLRKEANAMKGFHRGESRNNKRKKKERGKRGKKG